MDAVADSTWFGQPLDSTILVLPRKRALFAWYVPMTRPLLFAQRAVACALLAVVTALAVDARIDGMWQVTFFVILTVGAPSILPTGVGVLAQRAPPRLGATTIAPGCPRRLRRQPAGQRGRHAVVERESSGLVSAAGGACRPRNRAAMAARPPDPCIAMTRPYRGARPCRACHLPCSRSPLPPAARPRWPTRLPSATTC